MKETIFIDFDETLVDTVGVVLKKFYQKTGIALTTQDIKTWTYLSDTYGKEYEHFWISPGLYEDVAPLPGAIEFIDKLKEDYFPVVLTHSHLCIIEEKSRCIERLFGLPFIHEQDKWKFTAGSLIVDDGPHNILSHIEKHNSPGILFNLENSRGWAHTTNSSSLIRRACTYDLVLEELRRIRNEGPYS